MGSFGASARHPQEGIRSAEQKAQAIYAVDVDSVRDRVIDRLKKAGLSTSKVDEGSGKGRGRSKRGATSPAPAKRASHGKESALQGPTLTKIMQRRHSLSFSKEAMQVAQSIDSDGAKPVLRVSKPNVQYIRVMCGADDAEEREEPERDGRAESVDTTPRFDNGCPRASQGSPTEKWVPRSDTSHSGSSEQAAVQLTSGWGYERRHDAPPPAGLSSPSCYSRRSTSTELRDGFDICRSSDARLQAQIQAYGGQIAALQEELSAHRELGEERQVAIERLTAEARRKDEGVSELQSQLHSLSRAAADAEQIRLRSRLLAEHNCRLVGGWKQMLAEVGVDVSAVKEPSVGEVLGQGKEATEVALSVQLMGLEQCRAVLQAKRGEAAKHAKERSKLMERVGALSAEVESSRARERDAVERISQLEELVQRERDGRRAHEEAIRRSTEEQVMQGQVAKMIQSHSSTVAALQAAASKAEAAANRQAAAEAAATSLKQQLSEERAMGRRREEELAAEVRSAREAAQRKERSEVELQQRTQRLTLELQQVQQELSALSQKRVEEAASFRAKLTAAEEQAAKRSAAANRALATERERATEAREALNELLCEVEGLSASLEAERSRACSLSAALNTTREMVKTLRQQDHERGQRDEARRAELEEAHQTASQLSLRVEAQEAELRQRRGDSEALNCARQEVQRLKAQVASLSSTTTGVTAQTTTVTALGEQEDVDWLYAPPSPTREAKDSADAWEWQEPSRRESCNASQNTRSFAEIDSVDLLIPNWSPATPSQRRPSNSYDGMDNKPMTSSTADPRKEQELSALVDEVRRLQSRLAAKQQSIHS